MDVRAYTTLQSGVIDTSGMGKNVTEETIFTAAVALTSAQQRAAYLDEACGKDAALRARIEARLANHAEAHNPLEDYLDLNQPSPSAVRLSWGSDAPPICEPNFEEAAGSVIGRYKLLEKLGEGGFGAVYVAEQKEPIKRRVALKIIKLGMDTRQIVARFEAERQALAMMDHPNIAKVFDAGATQAGRPFFVMELVRGIPITLYCDKHSLPMKERLKLFIQICNAIQHAHQKGIIHRDIKPTNILVTLHDGTPVPKVIDFGIAKATHGELTDKTVYTQFQQFIGTPMYMSPEQAEMSGLDIDTRSDIYSLGVLLYELLTGKTPFDASELMQHGLDEIRRAIREKEAMRPSARLSRMSSEESTNAAQRRGSDRGRLIGMLRGDLDWIVMKCLEKDRTRRFATASGLSEDVQRYLDSRPVQARPPSKIYRLGKLARRNKLAFFAGVSVVLALTFGLTLATLGFVQASRQRDAADRARASEAQARQNAEENALRADRAAKTATRISESLQQLIASANPDAAKGQNYSVRQLLDDFTASLGTSLGDDPEVEAALRSTVGKAYWRLGFADEGVKQLARALALRRSVFGSHNPKTAETLVDYAWALDEQHSLREGEAAVREALAIYRENGVGGLPVIRALVPLEVILENQNRLSELEAVVQQAEVESAKSPGVEYSEIASIYHGLVRAKIVEGKSREAEAIARQSLAMHLRLQGPDHPETGWGYFVLNEALNNEGKYPEALDAGEAGIAIWLKVFPPTHWSISDGWDSILQTLQGAANSGDLPKMLSTPRQRAVVESLFLKISESKPGRPYGESLPAPFMRMMERLQFNSIYRSLAEQLRKMGKDQEAAACEQRLNELMNITKPFIYPATGPSK
jgi:serine/threonine protein kinase/tetratricopeptide (TPR) repeat protein